MRFLPDWLRPLIPECDHGGIGGKEGGGGWRERRGWYLATIVSSRMRVRQSREKSFPHKSGLHNAFIFGSMGRVARENSA